MTKDKKFSFTKTNITALQPPSSGRDVYYDSRVSGLGVMVFASGIKTFFVYKRIGTDPKKIKLGRFPELSVENARIKAIETLNAVSKGIDPIKEKRKLRNEITFKQLFDQYMEKYSKVHKKSWEYDEREVNKFLSQWFSRKVSAITNHEIQKLHLKIGKENGKYQANRILERIRAIYNKGIEWGLELKNPALGIRKFKEISRDRFIQPNELPKFFESLEAESNKEAKDYIFVSLFTGARKSNALAMKWEDINLQTATWRIPETKNGEAQSIPLPSSIVELLRVRKEKAKGDYVFPGKGKSGHFEEPKKAWKRILSRAEVYQLVELIAESEGWSSKAIAKAKLKAEANLSHALQECHKKAKELEIEVHNVGLKDLRIHDLRRTLGSWQAAAGASSYIIGKSLGHKSQQSTAVYARLNLDPVRQSVDTAVRAMLDAGKPA